jgi:hypothetical protein
LIVIAIRIWRMVFFGGCPEGGRSLSLGRICRKDSRSENLRRSKLCRKLQAYGKLTTLYPWQTL